MEVKQLMERTRGIPREEIADKSATGYVVILAKWRQKMYTFCKVLKG
jgi:hypothetical protein